MSTGAEMRVVMVSIERTSPRNWFLKNISFKMKQSKRPNFHELVSTLSVYTWKVNCGKYTPKIWGFRGLLGIRNSPHSIPGPSNPLLGSPYWPLEPGKRLNQKEINSKNKLIFPDNKWLFRIASQLHPGRQFQTETRVMNLKTKKS